MVPWAHRGSSALSGDSWPSGLRDSSVTAAALTPRGTRRRKRAASLHKGCEQRPDAPSCRPWHWERSGCSQGVAAAGAWRRQVALPRGAGETEAGQRAVLPRGVRAGCTRQGSAPLITAWRGPRGRSGHGLTQCQKPLLTRVGDVTNWGGTEPREGKSWLLGALLVLGSSQGPYPLPHGSPCSKVSPEGGRRGRDAFLHPRTPRATALGRLRSPTSLQHEGCLRAAR